MRDTHAAAAHPGAGSDDDAGSGDALPLPCSWFFLLGIQAHGLGLAAAANPYLDRSAAQAEWLAGWTEADRAERYERWREDAREAAYFDRHL